MIPEFGLLARPVNRHGHSRFEYDPYTLFLRDPQSTEGEDFGADVDKTQFFNRSALYHASVVHEHTHWLQHHATTIGALLSLIRFVQQRTAESMIADSSALVRRKLVDWRIGKGGSIVPLKQGDDLDLSALQSGHLSMDPIGLQIWYDCLSVDKLLLDADSFANVSSYPSRDCIGEVLADCFLYLESECRFGSYPGNDVARAVYRSTDPVAPIQTQDGDVLTTSNILECAAAINEMVVAFDFSLLMSTVNVPIRQPPALTSLLQTSYGRPLSWFSGLCRFRPDSWLGLLPSVAVACDLSLNPPVPPIYCSFERPIPWSELYPPYRFARFARAADSVGLLEWDAAPNQILEYSRRLCEVAQLQHPLEYPAIFDEWQGRIDLVKPATRKWDTEGGNANWYHAVLSTNELMWNLRREAWPVFSSYGECRSGTEKPRLYGDVLASYRGKRHWYVEPYLQHNLRGDRTKINGHINKTTGERIGLSIARNHLMFDFMGGSGEIDYSRFPGDMQRHYLKDMTGQFLAALGV